ncbi:MAG: NADH-quinone oxidoreductase subunit C [Rhodospirillaceae bacterium]|nr:NADH-quinone oxidoreductase subunit C [Rhodospirillaceae bacterium]
MTLGIEGLREISAHLPRVLGADFISADIQRGELTVFVKRESILKVVKTLRDDPQLAFTQVIDVTAVDYPQRPERFEVVYLLLSMSLNQRIRVKLTVGEETAVPSIASLFPCADWCEREVWDMYGVFFSDHPDLRRILTDYGFEGHPLRKDFPLTGYVEVRYDVEQRRVIYEPVKLAQDFRSFDFLSPWEGIQKLLPGDEKAAPAPAKPAGT